MNLTVSLEPGSPSQWRMPGWLWASAIILGLLLVLSGMACRADDGTMAPIPPQTGLVVDQIGALDEADNDALEARLRGIQESGRAQIAILTSAGTQGVPLASYALQVAESWQLGHMGRDDGLLILVIPSPPAVRIEVGYGLEGSITDLLAGRWTEELLRALDNGQLAEGLNRLLDAIETVLPPVSAPEPPRGAEDNYLFPDHPEWRLPFVLTIFSPVALFPLFFNRWGALASAPLLAAFWGGAAGTLWMSWAAAYTAALIALPLPLLWALNYFDKERLAAWLRFAMTIGNMVAVVAFFALITLFVGVGLSASGMKEIWAAPLFAGVLALGLAVFLFPGEPARILLLVLRSFCHFLIALILAAITLSPFVPDPAPLCFAAAGAFSGFAALGLYLESRERQRVRPDGSVRWSLICFGLAIAVALPFTVGALLLSSMEEDSTLRLTQLLAGGGSFTGTLWWAVRLGLFPAVRAGLGGRFGGGGASSGG